MKTITFTTKIKEGQSIVIPKKYLSEVSGEVQVILVLKEKAPKKKITKNSFKALKIKTKGFKFNRDEMYV